MTCHNNLLALRPVLYREELPVLAPPEFSLLVLDNEDEAQSDTLLKVLLKK